MRISDWSSDVCSSDLHPARRVPVVSVVAGVADEIPDRGIEHPCPPKGRVAKRFRDPATKKARDVAFRRKLIDLRQSGDLFGGEFGLDGRTLHASGRRLDRTSTRLNSSH